eukprot:5208680-Pyramimonas_sp.AAC.1
MIARLSFPKQHLNGNIGNNLGAPGLLGRGMPNLFRRTLPQSRPYRHPRGGAVVENDKPGTDPSILLARIGFLAPPGGPPPD